MSFFNTNFTTAAEMMQNLNNKNENLSPIKPLTANNTLFSYHLNDTTTNNHSNINPSKRSEKDSYSKTLFDKAINGSPPQKPKDDSEKISHLPQDDFEFPVHERNATKTSNDCSITIQPKHKVTNPYLKKTKKSQPCFNPVEHHDKTILLNTMKNPPITPNTNTPNFNKTKQTGFEKSLQTKISTVSAITPLPNNLPTKIQTTTNLAENSLINTPKQDSKMTNTSTLPINKSPSPNPEETKQATPVSPIAKLPNKTFNENHLDPQTNHPIPGIVHTGKAPTYDKRYFHNTDFNKVNSTNTSDVNQPFTTSTFAGKPKPTLPTCHNPTNSLKTKTNEPTSHNITYELDNDTEAIELEIDSYQNLLFQESFLKNKTDPSLNHYSDDLSHELNITSPPNIPFQNHPTNTQYTSLQHNHSTHINHSHITQPKQHSQQHLPTFKKLSAHFSRLSINEHDYKFMHPAFLSQPTAFILLAIEYSSKLVSITKTINKKKISLSKWDSPNPSLPINPSTESISFIPKSFQSNKQKLTFPSILENDEDIQKLSNDLENKHLEYQQRASFYAKQICVKAIEAFQTDRTKTTIVFLTKLAKLSIQHQHQSNNIPMPNTPKNYDTLACCICSYFCKYKLPDQFFSYFNCSRPDLTLQILSQCTTNQSKLKHFLECSLMSCEYNIATAVINEHLHPIFLRCSFDLLISIAKSDKIKQDDLLLRKYYEKDKIESSFNKTSEAIANITQINPSNISQIIADTTAKLLSHQFNNNNTNNNHNNNTRTRIFRRINNSINHNSRQSNYRGPRQNPRRGPSHLFGNRFPPTNININRSHQTYQNHRYRYNPYHNRQYLRSSFLHPQRANFRRTGERSHRVVSFNDARNINTNIPFRRSFRNSFQHHTRSRSSFPRRNKSFY